MDIKIPYKWLKEYLNLSISAKEFAELLSISGPSIEKYKYNKDIDDEILEIEVTSNRVDMASVIGIAREASTVLNTPILKTDIEIKKVDTELLPIKVTVEEPELALRFSGIVIKNVTVKDSPDWLKKRLIASGLNSINNIVDITNYVLLEYGQPSHAYDYDLISNHEIIVRKSRGEKITVLSGKEYDLPSEVLVIADSQSPIGIAGIKGGMKCEISNNTKNIFIEAANFNADLIRKISTKVLDLRTDASNLFEKNLSPQLTDKALGRIIQLIEELAGGEIASNLIDVRNFNEKPVEVAMELSLVKKTLGIEIPQSQIIQILTGLGFECSISETVLKVTIPYYRQNDILFDYDLVEEIARIYGYNKIPSILPMESIPVYTVGEDLALEEEIREILSQAGLTEVFTYSMISENFINASGIDESDHLKIDNPISADFTHLRSELGTSVLKALADNEKLENNLELFEVSNVYLKQGENALPIEESRLVIGVINKDKQEALSRLKGIIEYFFRKLGINVNTEMFKPSSGNLFYLQSAVGKIDQIGTFGIVSKMACEIFGAETPVAMVELSVKLLMNLKNSQKKAFTPIEKFPSATRDLAFVLDRKALWKDIEISIAKSAGEYFKSVELFDLYQGKEIATDKKSIAFHVVLQSESSTLTDKEIDESIKNITTAVEANFNGELRK